MSPLNRKSLTFYALAGVGLIAFGAAVWPPLALLMAALVFAGVGTALLDVPDTTKAKGRE